MCLSVLEGAAQLKVETTATKPDLSSESKPTIKPGIEPTTIASSVSDQKIVTIEPQSDPSAAPAFSAASLPEKPLTPDNNLHDSDGRHIFQ